MAISDKQERRIQGLLRYLSEYLSTRFEQACRINPNLKRVRNDLVWIELASVRQLLASLKGFGPERIMIVDILSSFDAAKKESLFSLTNQNTIYNQIVTEEHDKKEQMEGHGIRDLTSYYKMIDPSLERSITLIQTWLWWDLKDAVDLHMIDLQHEKVRALSRAHLSPELLEYYRAEMQEPSKELAMGQVMAFEFERAKAVAGAFEARRAADPGYKIVVKRDRVNDEELDALGAQLCACLGRLAHLRQSEEFPDEARAEYAGMLNCPAEAVTKKRVMEREEEAATQMRAKLRALLESEESWGEPYDFKFRQIQAIRDKLASMEERVRAAPGTPAA